MGTKLAGSDRRRFDVLLDLSVARRRGRILLPRQRARLGGLDFGSDRKFFSEKCADEEPERFYAFTVRKTCLEIS